MIVLRTEFTAEQQRAHLRMLAHGLRTMPPPNIRFTMATYLVDLEHPSPNECGTIGCAIGCGSYIVTPREINYRYFGEMYEAGAGRLELDGETALGSYILEPWDAYAFRVFGIHNYDKGPGEWCFSSDWEHVDNTPQGAAARIEWYLDNGLPDDWYEQMRARAPLCYGRVIKGVFHEL